MRRCCQPAPRLLLSRAALSKGIPSAHLFLHSYFLPARVLHQQSRHFESLRDDSSELRVVVVVVRSGLAAPSLSGHSAWPSTFSVPSARLSTSHCSIHPLRVLSPHPHPLRLPRRGCLHLPRCTEYKTSPARPATAGRGWRPPWALARLGTTATCRSSRRRRDDQQPPTRPRPQAQRPPRS